jgi:hypothetical protein
MIKIKDVVPGKLFSNNNRICIERIYINPLGINAYEDGIELEDGDIVLAIEIKPFYSSSYRSKHQIKVLFKEIVGYMYSDGFLEDMDPID